MGQKTGSQGWDITQVHRRGTEDRLTGVGHNTGSQTWDRRQVHRGFTEHWFTGMGQNTGSQTSKYCSTIQDLPGLEVCF